MAVDYACANPNAAPDRAADRTQFGLGPTALTQVNQTGGATSSAGGEKVGSTCGSVGTWRSSWKCRHKRDWARTTPPKHTAKGAGGAHTPQLTGKYAK